MKKNILLIIELLLIMLCFYYEHMINLTNIDLYVMLVLVLILFSVTKNIKYTKPISIFSLFFSLLLSFGNLNTFNFRSYAPIIFIIQILGFFFLTSRTLYFLQENINKIKIDAEKNNHKISKIIFFIISCTLGFIALLPYFLKYYPGILTTDSFQQIWQARGFLPYSNHHPWIHTLIIKFFYNIGYHFTHDVSKSIGFYTIFQMIVATFTYSYVTYTLYKNNIKKIFVALIWVFLFLFPFNAIYTVTMWKDVLFSYIILTFAVFIWNHYQNNLQWNRKSKSIFIILSFLMCLMRSNGLIAYFLFLIILLFVYRKEFMKLKFAILISIVLVFIVKIPIMSYFNVTNPDFVESLSIPLQQIAYVIKTDGDISKSEIKSLDKIADIEEIKKEKQIERSYHISDFVKNNVRRNDTSHYLDNNKGEYLKDWFSIGIKNFDEYIKAYVLQTSGYWYHNFGEYWIYSKVISVSPAYQIRDIDVFQKNLTPDGISKTIDTGLNTSSYIYYKIWSPAVSFYMILIGLYITIIKKKNILPYVPTIAVWLTLLIATPVACEFRYAYSLFISCPILLLLSLKNRASQTVTENAIMKTKKKSKGVKNEKRK